MGCRGQALLQDAQLRVGSLVTKAQGDAPGRWDSLAQGVTHPTVASAGYHQPHDPQPRARSRHNKELNPQGRLDVAAVFRKVRKFKSMKVAGLHQLDSGPENRRVYWRSLGARAARTKTTELLFPVIMILKTTPGWKATVFYWHAAKECCGMVLWVLCTSSRQTVPTKTLVAKPGLSAERSFGGQSRSTDFCLPLSFNFFSLVIVYQHFPRQWWNSASQSSWDL